MSVQQLPLLIITPVFNDWGSLHSLLDLLAKELTGAGREAQLLVVNDGSSSVDIPRLKPQHLSAIPKLQVLHLRRNIGHQRAITVALSYAEERIPCRAVVVMDADGEDKPADVIRLALEHESEGSDIIFAQRTKRSENGLFSASYFVYRTLYKLLTGQQIRVGNFSLIPSSLLKRVVIVSEIWNHYSSGILKARLPHRFIACERGTRLNGESKMSYVALVVHGLSAISVYGDVIGVRALIATLLLAFSSLLLMLIAVLLKTLTPLAIPGWATYAVGMTFIMFLQFISISFLFAFLVLTARNNYSFIPKRDYHYFVLETQDVT